ncbi:Nramp family divalent metal transporter [Planctomicrobium sp. SH664]|uniref:Nramp family divalent metal transporter n=1 Tax=Planctomicrobium sp. SH664 TaxID=3448125 RepID=UPI003F5B6317
MSRLAANVPPSEAPHETVEPAQQAPWPGTHAMPCWGLGQLGPAPAFSWRTLPLLIGPGLVMGAAAIGGGEWLTGPFVTAKYGGALLWLATLSILFQVVYNIEISRYALYSGEPIFSGKFRIPPGPLFWLLAYLLLDCGSFLPYLTSNAAIPAVSLILGRLPHLPDERWIVNLTASILWVLIFLPLVVGGKVFNSLKIVTIVKLAFVLTFLGMLAICYSTWETWCEILSGFFRFGTLPFESPTAEGSVELQNVFRLWWSGESIPRLDFALLGMVTAMAAIAGNGGLTNTPISNYTRDQGWGMGREVGAIPSIVGGREISLSHVGKVFLVDQQSLPKWYGWLRHIRRDQILMWFPACLFGMALPSMLSVQFLPKGDVPGDKFLVSAMTAEGVAHTVSAGLGAAWGPVFWKLTLFCGFLVLITSAIVTADGILRRWVDLFWTASPTVRSWETRAIGRVYFAALLIYGVGGLVTMNLITGDKLLVWSTNIYNYALGFSCWHVLVVNLWLLPRALQPRWFVCLGLAMAGLFFTSIAVLTTLDTLSYFRTLAAT